MKISIKRAENDDEREAAYRLRFQVFAQEKQDCRYVDYYLEQYRDAVDDSSLSVLYVAREEAYGVVGTLRISLRRNGKFIADDAYNWDLLANHTKMSQADVQEKSALFERGVVSPNFRAKGVFSQLNDFAEEFCRQSGCKLALAVPSTSNLQSQDFLLRRGFVILCESRTTSFQGLLLCKRL